MGLLTGKNFYFPSRTVFLVTVVLAYRTLKGHPHKNTMVHLYRTVRLGAVVYTIKYPPFEKTPCPTRGVSVGA